MEHHHDPPLALSLAPEEGGTMEVSLERKDVDSIMIESDHLGRDHMRFTDRDV